MSKSYHWEEKLTDPDRMTGDQLRDLLVSYRVANDMCEAHLSDYLGLPDGNRATLSLDLASDYRREMRAIEERIAIALKPHRRSLPKVISDLRRRGTD
jgi:hypothetical protein